MTLTGNKLTPSEGMHLQRKSDGSVAEGAMYIPSSLTVDDFIEITHEEYLRITQSNSTPPDPLTDEIDKLKRQTKRNSDEITSLQEALCEVYETII